MLGVVIGVDTGTYNSCWYVQGPSVHWGGIQKAITPL